MSSYQTLLGASNPPFLYIYNYIYSEYKLSSTLSFYSLWTNATVTKQQLFQYITENLSETLKSTPEEWHLYSRYLDPTDGELAVTNFSFNVIQNNSKPLYQSLIDSIDALSNSPSPNSFFGGPIINNISYHQFVIVPLDDNTEHDILTTFYAKFSLPMRDTVFQPHSFPPEQVNPNRELRSYFQELGLTVAETVIDPEVIYTYSGTCHKSPILGHIDFAQDALIIDQSRKISYSFLKKISDLQNQPILFKVYNGNP